ncbi:amidohydrolase [Flavobacterium pectinovorum]|uniref:amidohydrolase n=1 Tax=Flavobacterium pectinovorum TaxID=29533 RepID=UPI001FABB494|nr:amidohydrolase [Flavobacterium pectinovorum]MCI9846707.1 amidohydrolase [Flavobacterium pectinovorum]
MKNNFKWFAVIFATTIINAQQKNSAEKIFINGNIITVDAKNSTAQAVAVSNGKILAVGTNASIEKLKDKNTVVVDLKGKTVVPGFIDGHSHFMGLSRSATVNVGSPPMGTVKNIPDLVKRIQDFQKEKNIAQGEWIDAYGYDQDQLEEKRHPNKEDLDAAFPNNPVTITNINGHMSVSNSYALKLSGIDTSTANPAGGAIERKKGTNEPTGLLQENAGRLLKRPAKPAPSLDDQIKGLKEQQLFYASNGITTAQDGYTSFEALQLLKKAADKNALFIDIEALPGYPTLDKVLENPEFKFGVLKNHLKLAGTKMIADGSPQGKTAFFSKSYLVEVPGCNHDHCTGFPNITQEQFDALVIKTFQNNIRPFVHCNGDATIDMYLKAIENANKTLNVNSSDRRPVTIHSQFVRPDQLDGYKKLGIIAALFSNHAFFWGDVHTRNLGIERASFLSPLKSALKKGVVATNHTDYPVTPLNQLFLLWTSVERKSRTGQVIGPDERLTPIEGLRAITINGAYEYFEENSKGSIEAGKLADLVVLSDDLTKIEPSKIKDITVLETIKEGKTIFKKD